MHFLSLENKMKILFVSSGNIRQLNPIVENQGESLRREGINLEFFTIKGKGVAGYMKNIVPLRKKIMNDRIEVIHAHYSLSAFTATLTLKRPLVVSLMGSDVFSSGLVLWLIRFLSKFYWDATIVKSEEMKIKLNLRNAHIVPNGINIKLFRPIDRIESCRKLDWDPEKKHILFPANKNRPVKNFKLADDAFHLLNTERIQLHTLENVPNPLMPYYYNAADVVLLTSLWEGSPNVIKEALACNAPVVATDVGDIRYNLGALKNCFVTGFDPIKIADALKQVIESGDRTEGRRRITELGLEESEIAQKLNSIYINVITKRKHSVSGR
jgi:teichuronic acid biosynthesis glycosyltransferase TuaC